MNNGCFYFKIDMRDSWCSVRNSLRTSRTIFYQFYLDGIHYIKYNTSLSSEVKHEYW